MTALLAGMHAGPVLLAARVPAFTTPVAAGPDAVRAHLPAAVYQALGPAYADLDQAAVTTAGPLSRPVSGVERCHKLGPQGCP